MAQANSNRIDIEGRRIYFSQFTSLNAAELMTYRAARPMRIIMGDAPFYWVVTPADAQRLVKAGYEMI
jgi:hypothetical protein